jgi:glycosyltransferase involved in cell wall biosynthesis
VFQGDSILIVHFSTVHLRDDSRIRSKMMDSLHSRYPCGALLLVQDGLGNEFDKAGYKVIDTGPRMRRLKRVFFGGYLMFREVLKLRPKIAHFHDPELIPWAVLLQLCGISVIYDVHEDYPAAVAENGRLPYLLQRVFPPVVLFFEWFGSMIFSGIVAVTPQIAARFRTNKTVVVRNWPIIAEYENSVGRPMIARQHEVAYIGTITLNRNVIGMLDAIHLARDVDAVLRLAGDFPVQLDEEKARVHCGWERVKFDGRISRGEVADLLSSVRAGLLVLKPIKHETLTLPIKLFEYMAAGLPVVYSDFPVWREIVGEVRCGLPVDPLKPEEIADAIRWILENPEEAAEMGQRGREAAFTRYNWESQVKGLFCLYDKLLEI